MRYRLGILGSTNLTPLALTWRGSTASSTTAATITLSNFPIGDPVEDRNVIVVAWSTDSNGPVPSSCTVSGIACTRVALQSGNLANAVFITNSPLPTGTTASATVGWTGPNISNRMIGAYTVVGKINRTPVFTFGGSTSTVQSVPMGAGGVMVATGGRYSSTAALDFTGLNQDVTGTVASNHRYTVGSYSAASDEVRNISGSGGSWAVAAFNLAA